MKANQERKHSILTSDVIALPPEAQFGSKAAPSERQQSAKSSHQTPHAATPGRSNWAATDEITMLLITSH